ncbi:MAG: fumarylacetoacetate hydrolase family protein, partial [Candidatus Eremiobacteraeota bacterium]|nr:fumarylacetoacetate hydrolase family protein [Candidatus Eremiobacteraeota bacterium]
MRFATYRDRSGRRAAGILLDRDRIAPLRSGITLDEYIALDASERAGQAASLGEPVSVTDVQLLAPVHPRKNVFCVGRNYLAHAEEGARARGAELKLPDVPTFFTKAPTAIAAPDETLELDPSLSPEYDWEAELAVVIGKRCRDVPEHEALSVVFGYTCLNDVTARDLQRAHLQWFKGKSLDHTCPLGPWIVEADEIEDPQRLEIALTV